jgi:PAS domain S-box-containing protein
MRTPEVNHRILLIDDNPAIHEDFKKILGGCRGTDEALAAATAAFFDEAPRAASARVFELDSAFQGREGLAKIKTACEEGRPYAMAFVDVRMPPGWDGVETIGHIWKEHPELQVVICTAYADYSWEEITKNLRQADSLLILKKPFDNVEVLQMAHALTKKWTLAQQAKERVEDLERLVMERAEELRASDARFAKAFQSNPLPMAIQTLRDERFVDVNDSFLKLCGQDRENVVQRTPAELALWPNAARHEQVMKQIVEHKSAREMKCSFRNKAGEVRETLLYAELFDLNGQACLLTLLQDISERLSLESQLRQSQKMKAVGQLAAGVAHDFNNILTIVQGHLGLVAMSDKLGALEQHSVKQALLASERASNLTRQLLAFSRKQVIERKPVSLHELVDQLGGMLKRLIGDHIHMELLCPRGLPPIDADPCNIEQVIMNLVVNARDAMPDGGRLTVSAAAVEVDDAVAAGNPEASAGHFVCLSIVDTGCGMDAALRARIFEPFFTTKDVGKGTGMGLATVYGIVKQHKGWLEVNSEVGKGTTFRVYFPVSNGTPDASLMQSPAAPTAPGCGNETILLVEDEPGLRELFNSVLSQQKYRVLTAATAAEALALWETHANAISLLLTDMGLPGGISGKELAERLVREKPGLKVICTSGYSADALGDNAHAAGACPLLQKPYTPELLIKTVRNCLDAEYLRGGVINNRWATAGNL